MLYKINEFGYWPIVYDIGPWQDDFDWSQLTQESHHRKKKKNTISSFFVFASSSVVTRTERRATMVLQSITLDWGRTWSRAIQTDDERRRRRRWRRRTTQIKTKTKIARYPPFPGIERARRKNVARFRKRKNEKKYPNVNSNHESPLP